MLQPLNAQDYTPSLESVFIDVRSLAEFAGGHIPSAINIPLFSNEERAAVGTIYKQNGSQAAIKAGLLMVSLSRLTKAAETHINNSQEVVIYCARGGMRSQSIGHLYHLLGYNVRLLKGGYKSYRNWVRARFELPYNIIILSGKTGSGKTEVIARLQQAGAMAIDLEKLARHKGSVFGGLQSTQPTQEHFENLLAQELFFSKDEKLFLEDESRFIGRIRIPDALFNRMTLSKALVVEDTYEGRMKRILKVYSSFPKEAIKKALICLNKQLGGERLNIALHYLATDQYEEGTKLMLAYYDRKYEYGIAQREAADGIIGHLPFDAPIDNYIN